MYKNHNFQDNLSENNNDEVDLRNLFHFLLRNKFFIGLISLLTFTVACFYSLTLKKVWEGQFQIVLNSDQDSRVNSLNPALTNFLGVDQIDNNLKTEVGILKSPSVLMPIYDFVNEKNNKGKKIKLPFYKWKKNLKIELQKDTSILNIAYRDTNKKIVLPALDKMSLIYQDYSGRSLKRNQELTRKYLVDQISLFREKSKNSIKAAQNFAIDQNLIYLGTNNYQNFINSNSDLNSEEEVVDFKSNFLPSNINIENVRVNAANEIRRINLRIQKINDLSPSDYENLQYFVFSIPALSKDEALTTNLSEIEDKLIVLRSKYTDQDPGIINLLEQRKLAIALLKSKTIKYLKAAKLEAEATMEAAMRPKGVLLEYKELIREAARDEGTLVALENDFRILQLQKAKISDPWQLITKPTLLKNPVAPSRRNIGIIGLLFGALLGALISFYKERKSDKIFSLSKLKELLSAELIEIINKNDQLDDSNKIMFLKEFLNNQNCKNIAFITLEEANTSYLKKLKDFLTNKTNLDTKIELISSRNIMEECNNAELIILFTSLRNSSFSEIKTLNNRLNFLEKSLKGFILLDE